MGLAKVNGALDLEIYESRNLRMGLAHCGPPLNNIISTKVEI